MRDNRAEIEQKLGTTLGEKGNSPKPVLETFRERGVLGIHPKSISRLRAGMISGERIDWRLAASRVLEQDDASLKNLFYQQITKLGLEHRAFNTSRLRSHILKSDYYIEDVANNLGQDPQVVRRCIRGMRTDMVFTEANSPEPALLRNFSNIAQGYIDAHRRVPPSLRSPAITILGDSWDQTTMENFYRNIYAAMGGRAIGTWTPYEIEILALFYTQQAQKGNHLTPFDSLVLDSYIKGLPGNQIIGEIKRSVGIEVDGGVMEQHRNILVYGRPAYHPKQK